jgi:transcription-repair coupling factor (superfamily II helicase)
MYKRVAGVETESQLKDVRSELIDRYGETPSAVRNLLEYAALKLQAMRVGATAIERKREFVNIKFSANAGIDPGKLARFVASQRGTQFTPDGTLKFSIKIDSAGGILQTLRDLLEELEAREEAARQI